MRKIIVVVVLVAAIAGGYSLFWFKKADDFKKMVEQSIANANAEAKSIDSAHTLLRYSAIDITGYPFTMTLKLQNPVVDLPVSALLAKMPPRPGATPPAKAPFDWVEEISYSDSIAFSADITGSHFTLVTSGDRTHKTLVDNAPRHILVASSASPFVCQFTIAPQGFLWNMHPIFTDLPTFLDIFRALDCNVKGMALKDEASAAALGAMDSFSVSSGSSPSSGGNYKFAFTLSSKNAKVDTAMDAILNDYSLMVYTLLGIPAEQRAQMTSLSLYGNQNVAIDFVYDGPADQAHMTSPDMHFRVDVNSFSMHSDIFNFDGEAHLASTPSGDKRNAALTIHSQSDVSEAYDQIVQKQFAAVFMQMKDTKPTTPEEAMIAQTVARLGSPEEVAATLLPKMHDFGKTNVDIDAKVSGPNNPQDMFNHGNLTLDALNWVSVPYGLKLKGDSNMSVANKMPSGNLSITCLTCDALITDLGNYAMRVEALMSRAQTPPQPLRINAGLIEGVRQFIHGVAASSTDKDLIIQLQVKDTGAFTVSGKQIPEVMMLFASTIAPHLQSPAAGSATPKQ